MADWFPRTNLNPIIVYTKKKKSLKHFIRNTNFFFEGGQLHHPKKVLLRQKGRGQGTTVKRTTQPLKNRIPQKSVRIH